MDSEKLVTALVEFGKTISGNELVFTNNPAIGNLIENDPFGFLMAGCLDRGMSATTAWSLPAKLRAVLGHLDPRRLSGMSEDEVLAALQRIDGKPRYLTAACKTIIDLAGRVCHDYRGDPRSLWQGQRSWTIKERLQAIYGVGPGIASMIVNLLAVLGAVQLAPEDYAAMDVKPDVHVKRVFERLGFCHKEASEQQVVATARTLRPAYPAELDPPAWHIGRQWCHATQPACVGCPIGSVCPKLGRA